MFTWYNVFKFVHVLAATVWVGGVMTLAVLNARLAREKDDAALRLLAGHGGFVGRAVMGPAAGLTLITGLALAGLMGWGFPLWFGWGLAGVFGSVLLGASVMRRGAGELQRLATAGPDHPRVAALRRRLALAGALNLLLLLSTVWAMVFKPSF